MDAEQLARILEVAARGGYRVVKASDAEVILREAVAVGAEPPRKPRPRTIDEALGIDRMAPPDVSA